MENPKEIWQVKVNGEVYDTDFEELTSWVFEHSVMETDEVRRGDLRWLEAGKVPMLREFFNAGNTSAEQLQVNVTTNEGVDILDAGLEQQTEISQTQSDNIITQNSNEDFAQDVLEVGEKQEFTNEIGQEIDINYCTVHPDEPSKVLCSVCFHPFCGECPTTYGTVKTCPYCGGICEPIKKVEEKNKREVQFNLDFAKNFGLVDFGKALAYPFKYKTSLIFGSLMFAVFSLGQGAANMGSMFLIVGALICFMFANSLVFGVLANTIENFAKGYTDKNFMPSFDDFNVWDDIVHPFFLSVGIWVSSFGLFIALIAGGFWFSWNTISGEISNSAQSSSVTVTPQSSIEAIDYVKQITEKFRKQNDGRLNLEIGEDGLTESQRATVDKEAEFRRINDLAKNYRKDQLENTIGKTTETKDKEINQIANGFMQNAGLILIFAGIALVWGLFYFPAACAVAGYTRSFTATVNPLIGLDTIKHLGFDYLKLVLMFIVLILFSTIVGGVLSSLLSPLDLPILGNLPAKFIGSIVTFYISVVFAVLLGYVVYKNSKKLQIFRG